MSWCVMIMHNDDMITFLIIFLTSGMLQSFPLQEIASRDLQSAKSVGLSSGKGNVLNTLTFNLFIKQQELTWNCKQDQKTVVRYKGFYNINGMMEHEFQMRVPKWVNHINCRAIMDHDRRPRYPWVPSSISLWLQSIGDPRFRCGTVNHGSWHHHRAQLK